MMKFVFPMAALLLLSGLTACSQTNVSNDFNISFPKAETILPVSYRSGANPVIPVTINGKGPYKFMFDTGSPGLVKLDEKVFTALGLPVTDSILAGDGSGVNSRSFPVTTLQSVELGDYKITNVQAMVRNYNTREGIDAIDGVIGTGFFKDVVVDLNFEKNELTIRKGKLASTDKNVYPLLSYRGVPGMKLGIGNKKLDVMFDTGNMGQLTLHSSEVSKEMMAGEPVVVGRAQTVNNSFEIKQVALKEPVKLGDLVFENPVVTMNDLLPRGNAGIQFLKQLNITFDVTNNLVKLVKIPPTFSANTSSALNEYAGQYGDRKVTVGSDGSLYIQRPGGTVLKMIEKKKDEFGLEAVSDAVLQFERNDNNKVVAIKVKRGNGDWEKSTKNS